MGATSWISYSSAGTVFSVSPTADVLKNLDQILTLMTSICHLIFHLADLFSCWVFFSKSTCDIYLFRMYLLLFDFSLSARWFIVTRCLRNTWHGPHRLSDLGIKTSQFIVHLASSSSTVLNILFSIFALIFFCLSWKFKSVPWASLFFITSGKSVSWTCMKL